MLYIWLLVFSSFYSRVFGGSQAPNILCVEYAEKQGIPCDRASGFCFVDSLKQLIDACLVSMCSETPDRNRASVTKMTPDKDQHTGYPSATIPPADFTQYHPLYGSMTGYEEPNYHLGLLPQDPNTLDTHLVFHDREYNNTHDVAAINSSQLVPLIKPERQHNRVFILSHDFNDQYETDPMLAKLIESLIHYQSNSSGLKNAVIMVDSKAGTKAGLNGTFYKQAAANAILIGRQVARWFTRLHLNRNKPEGYLARVGRLTGLDPIATHFEGFRPLFGESPHIMLTDARRVDVITTSAGKLQGTGKDLLEGNYGMAQRTGMRHFFPNAGHNQPACDGTMESPFERFRGVFSSVSMCSHQKALQYFIHSLEATADREKLTCLRAIDWDQYVQNTKENSWATNSAMAVLGIEAFAEDAREQGNYYMSNSISSVSYDIMPIDVVDQSNKKEQVNSERRLLQVPSRYDSEETFATFPIQAVPHRFIDLNDAPSCGKFRSSTTEGRVFRGQLPYEGQFPWAVCIIAHVGKWKQICTGAILSSKFILTAAHCFE
ncbi:Pancreatic triacylglycerol lipase [Halotydeus destructor]|nr:Pancreatic triacylglycerol lipase [Halotydeus destructor]